MHSCADQQKVLVSLRAMIEAFTQLLINPRKIMHKSITYIDVYEQAGGPVELLEHVVRTAIWPAETLEHHLECLREFHDTRNSYQDMENTRREVLDQATLRRLQTLVGYAYQHIPFYNRLYRGCGFEPGDLKSLKDFSKLPIINKSDLRAVRDEVAANPFVKINFMSRTSGSTGVPLSVINDTDRQRHWFVKRLLMFEQMMGERLSPGDWMYSIYYEPFFLTSILGDYKTFTVGLNADTLKVADHIRKIRPKLITGVGNQILKVARLLPDARELGILAFTTNSESSSIGERRLLEKLINVPILDEYSSEELGIIAWEQRDGSYMVAEDTVHVELVGTDDQSMEQVVGTDLWNFTMPRIRYNQGDYAEWKSAAPKIGLRRLARIIGRQDMSLVSPMYGQIDPGLILEIADTTLLPESAGVAEFRVVQKSMQEVHLLIKPMRNGKYLGDAVEAFTQRFLPLFGSNIKFTVFLVDELPHLGVKKRCILRDYHD